MNVPLMLTTVMRMPTALTLMEVSNALVFLVIWEMEPFARVRSIFIYLILNCKLYYVTPFCIDIDECETELDNCHENANCSDTVGSFECTCVEGYEGDGVIQCESKIDYSL